MPFLFISTGSIESEPLGFYDDLADKYDAQVVSADSVRYELYGNSRSRSSQIVGEVNRQADARVKSMLEDGSNVVYDSLLNTSNRRKMVVEGVAKPTGATALLIVVNTPRELIRSRIIERYKEGEPIAHNGRTLPVGGALSYVFGSMERIEYRQ